MAKRCKACRGMGWFYSPVNGLDDACPLCAEQAEQDWKRQQRTKELNDVTDRHEKQRSQ